MKRRELLHATAAFGLEYEGQGWLDGSSNAVYAHPPTAAAGRAICPVCWMEVDPASAPQSVYRRASYFFCTEQHKQRFDSAPETFLDPVR